MHPASKLNIAQDGNCLFSSLSYCIYGHQHKAMQIRFEIVSHVDSHWEYFKDFIIGSNIYDIPISSQSEYCNFMKVHGRHGGHIELVAASRLYNMRLNIFQDSYNSIPSTIGETGPLFSLLYTGDGFHGHYDIINFNENDFHVDRNLDCEKQIDGNRPTNYESLLNENEKRRAVYNKNVDQREITNKTRRGTYKNRNAKKQCTGMLGEISENVSNVEYLDIGDMSVLCSHCGASSFSGESCRSGHNCCHKGTINLPNLDPYPEIFRNLLYGTEEINKHFRENIRIYNNLFAFASFNAQNIDIKGKGPYSMRIVGTVGIKATTSLQRDVFNHNPRFGQIYIYDDGEAMIYRAQTVKRQDVLEILQPVMNQNPYAQQFRNLFQIYNANIDEEIYLDFYSKPTDHPRVYNKPTCNELAAIIVSKDGDIKTQVDVRVYPNDEHDSKFMPINSPHVDPMLFPLLFPTGETGWTWTMKQSPGSKKNLSPVQYYGYRLAFHPDKLNQIHFSQRLSQHYIINAYVKIEGSRLFYIEKKLQNQLRTEHIQGLIDHLQNSTNNTSDKFKLGKAVILPSSFQGSPRAMQQLYHDAMAISRNVGRPDLFITMTCNPKWPEIKRFLQSFPPGTTASDIPTFVCRLFYQKCLVLLKELESVFGSVRGYIYTFEFQKRGLPHMHLLVTLNDKLLTADDVDRFISAEIPNTESDPSLWYKVIKHMSHGPHGKQSPCWDEETRICSKKFPKPFIETTDMTKPGFPLYQRRDNRLDGNTYHRKNNNRKIYVDNSMIVPYNPYLLKRFDCHINVEYCASVMSIKYIHKYIHKGHDRARVTVGKDEMRNEVQSYIDSRYVSSMESAWRIMEIPMHSRSHNVELLPIHLPGQNQISFTEGKEHEAINSNKVTTKLLAYFELNKIDVSARQYTYSQIPLHYTWDTSKKVWKKRKISCKVVARLNIVSPRDIERFNLKLLLRHTKGITSFEELRSVQGVTYITFQEAARAAGLSKSENYMLEMMGDAAFVMMPHKLRHFFVYLIMTGEVDASMMWEKFKDQLSEHCNEATALYIIRELLENEGMTMKQFGLPEHINESQILSSVAVHEDLSTNQHHTIYQEMYAQLNSDQLNIFHAIKLAIIGETRNNSQHLFFVDGPGGTGKTYLYKCIVHFCKYMGKKISTLAWTGIAAILLPYGRTAHKTFGLPLNVFDDRATLNWTRKMKQQLHETNIFIWDEASMIPKDILSIIEKTFRDVFSSDILFAGKIFVLGGDFRQVLPVVKKGGRRQIYEACIKNSALWGKFHKFQLLKNMRADGDSTEFANWLLDIGNKKVDQLQLSKDMICDDLIEEFYPFEITTEQISSRAILAARNDEVRKINLSIIKRLPGEIVKCISIDQAESLADDKTDDENISLQYPLEYLQSMTPSGLPPAELFLKPGCIVMLLRNLCISNGLCNGTRLIVRRIDKTILHCEILTGDNNGNIVHIPRITLTTRGDNEMPFILSRLQFPVRLAFAMTINKSQGQTFDKVGLIVASKESIFTHGQLYVALSRCKSKKGIKFECKLKEKVVNNIVFEEALV